MLFSRAMIRLKRLQVFDKIRAVLSRKAEGHEAVVMLHYVEQCGESSVMVEATFLM